MKINNFNYYYTNSFVKKDLVSDDLLALYNFNELIYIDYNVEVFKEAKYTICVSTQVG